MMPAGVYSRKEEENSMNIISSFKNLTKTELVLWLCSLTVVAVSNLLAGQVAISTLLGTLVGVTALIFIAKGDVLGQVLTVVFAVLYSITSLEFHYYGEIITYLGMTAPMAIAAIASWLRHPTEKGKNEVKIHKLKKYELALVLLSTLLATTVFGYVLYLLNTPNLAVGTVSITTSFLACALTFYRNPYYALAYAANDIVLIILWILAAIENITYLPMIACFAAFLVNDAYGFYSWRKREALQGHD